MDNSLSAYAAPPAIGPQAGFSIWAPGLWLMRRLSLRRKLLILLLFAWLPLLALWLLLMNGSTPRVEIAGLEPLRSLVDGRSGLEAVPRWAPLGTLVMACLASLYLGACAWRALFADLDRLRRGAQDMASGVSHPHSGDFGSDELGQALAALDAAAKYTAHLRDAARQHADVVACSARELADAHLALQLEALAVRAATNEIARRTIALCGMLDSDIKDAERASADLDAIRDEEAQTLQLMAALRSRLFSLAHHCQALGEASRAVLTSRPKAADPSLGELASAAGVDITHCHQLSERVGGAERLNERRIESMRLSTDRLVCRAERGMREAQQLMVLSRQVEASLATTLQRLEQMAASGASLRALAEEPAPARPATASIDEPAAP
jgi:hypothetical protein